MAIFNFTPARTDNRDINEASIKLSELFANLEDFEAKNGKEARYGYIGLPGILQLTREIGIDKVFFFGEDYQGHYDDDDCYFTYWNEVEKKFEHDMWSTRAAYPHYDLYEMPIAFSSAWDAEMIDKNAYLEEIKKIHIENLSKYSFDENKVNNYFPHVKVERGRKWKGEGYLLGINESSYRFASPMYHNRYYGTRDFGVTTSYIALIYDPINNTINRANAEYLQYLDKDNITSAYLTWAKQIISQSTISDIHVNGQNFVGTFDLTTDYSFDRFMTEEWLPKYNLISSYPTDAYDVEEEEKKKKEAEFRAAKMPELIEWVKKNTTKTGDDIIKLAVHIYEKKYGKK